MKIALVSPDALTVWLFRKGLIRRLISEGHSVYVFCAPDSYQERVEGLGVVCVPVELSRFVSPVKDIGLLVELYKQFRKERFDLVHNFTPKPNIYGAIAAHLAGCQRVVCMVEGLGFVFSSRINLGSWAKVKALSFLYWVAFGVCDRVCFMNPDDLGRFVSTRLVKRHKAVLIRSAGIDLTEFSPDAVDPKTLERLREELRISEGTRVVIMVSRLVWSKGVAEFVQAAEMLHARYPSVKFLLVGQLEERSLQAIPSTYIEQKQSDWLMRLGFRDEVRELMVLADIVVLPSYYGEGTPKVLLEGMAMGKPIVTTDNVGCRETVDHGKNGYLIPVQDPQALASALETLLTDDNKRIEFGRESLLKVRREFDEKLVVDRILTELYQLPQTNKTAAH